MLRRHRKSLFFAAAGITMAAVLGFAFLREREPEYNGHPLHYWLDLSTGTTALPATDYSWQRRHDDSQIAIRHIGTNAIPFLLKWLSYDSPPTMRAIERFVWRGGMFTSPFARLPFFRQRTRADAVFNAFAALGCDATCAIPALTQIAENPEKPQAARRARTCIGVILIMSQKSEKPGSLSPLFASALTNRSQVVSNVATDLQTTLRATVYFAPPQPEVSLSLTNVYPPTPLPIGDH